MTVLTRGARASAQRSQAGLAAVNGVAGTRNHGEFGPGVHQPGGVAEAGGHPRVVGRGGGGVRVGHLSPAERRRSGQGAGSEAGLRLAAGPRDLGAPRIRADGRNRSCAANCPPRCAPRPPTRSPRCAPSWPRCGPTWRSCSTPTCLTGLRSRPIGHGPRLQRLAAQHGPRPGHQQQDRHRGPRGHRRRTPRKARSSTSPPNRIRRRTNGRRSRVTAARTAGRRRPSRRSGDVAQRSRRARGHHRRATAAAAEPVRSPHPSPNSLGSHRNRSARRAPPPEPPAAAAAPRAGARSRRRRRRIGSRRPPRESGYPRAPRAATGCRLPCRIRRLSRRARTAPPANTSARRRGTPSRATSQSSSPREPAPRPPLAPPPDAADPGRPPAPPTLAADSGGPRHTPEPDAADRASADGGAASPQRRRHTGGQSVAELLARLQVDPDGRRPSPAPRGVS